MTKRQRAELEALRAAVDIAAELFTNHRGHKVGQLRLMASTLHSATSYGGWCVM